MQQNRPAKAWMPKPGTVLKVVSDERLTEKATWRDIPFETMSQMLAMEAAALRILELGKDIVQATESVRATKVVPTYAENLPRLPDGTPIPDFIERTVYDPSGNQIRHYRFDNR